MKVALVAVLALAMLASTAQAGYFECGVCQSLLHFWSSARVDSSFKQVCDAFPNYVPITYDQKTGAPIPVTDKDSPKDTHHGLPVTHMERCERVTETLLLRLAEEGIVQVRDTTDAQVFAPTTWENPAILEILCTYVYPKVGSGYCKGEYGGKVDDKCNACINYLQYADINGVSNPACVERPQEDQALCQFVEQRINALPTNANGASGALKALKRSRDISLVEGRFLACRDFLGICNETIKHPLANPGATTEEVNKMYNQAYDPYWASRNLYTVPNGAAPVQAALSTKSKVTSKKH